MYQQAEGALPNHHTAHPTAPNQIWTFPRTQRASRKTAKLAESLGRVNVETMVWYCQNIKSEIQSPYCLQKVPDTSQTFGSGKASRKSLVWEKFGCKHTSGVVLKKPGGAGSRSVPGRYWPESARLPVELRSGGLVPPVVKQVQRSDRLDLVLKSSSLLNTR